MLQAGFHCFLSAVLSGIMVTMVGYAFVDDTDLILTAEDNTTPARKLLNRFQDAVNYWEGLLRATGGTVEPSKTFWYLVDFKWDKGKWQYHSSADQLNRLHIKHQE